MANVRYKRSSGFYALNFQFITKLFSKIQTLNLSLIPLLRLYIVPVAQI